MIAKSPEDRYQDCHILLEDINAYLGGTKETEVLHAAAPPPLPLPDTAPTPPVPPANLEQPTVPAAVVEPPQISSVAVPAKKKTTALIATLSVAVLVISAAVLGFLFKDQLFGRPI